MASEWESFCLAVIADLQGHVPELRDGSVFLHPFLGYDPEQLIADGERHLAVFAVAEQAQEATPLTTAGLELAEVYRVLYWEDAGAEATDGVADVEAGRALYTLARKVKDRFIRRDVQTLGGAFQVKYLGAAFAERAGSVRWFAVGVEAHRAQDFI